MKVTKEINTYFSSHGINARDLGDAISLTWPFKSCGFNRGWYIFTMDDVLFMVFRLCDGMTREQVNDGWDKARKNFPALFCIHSKLEMIPSRSDRTMIFIRVGNGKMSTVDTRDMDFAFLQLSDAARTLWGTVAWESATLARKYSTSSFEKFVTSQGYVITTDSSGSHIFKADNAEKDAVKEEDVRLLFPSKEHSEAEMTGAAKASESWKKGEGGGFESVAGMKPLKDRMLREVLWPITHRDEAKTYRLTPPNGMLLYGPPGCGKTFFAEQFAREAGMNYKVYFPSDLGSPYIHGSQNAIASMFKEAEKNAPCVICLDEVDAMLPARDSSIGKEHSNGEVNEFLAQLCNCGSRGIFVIGTTNQKDLIDPAALRKGRLDIQVEIPEPDRDQRASLFDVCLKDRPVDEGVDTGVLAESTAGYVAADIAFIVNDASLSAAMSGRKVSQELLAEAVKRCKPSSAKQAGRRIGFK